MKLTSTAFDHGGPIPVELTCQGRNSSPALAWTGTPTGTRSLALVVDDPDAPCGTWVHWLLYDLPPEINKLEAELPRTQYVAGGAKQGLNDFKHLGYGGPCPPPGKAHRYFFRLYALDCLLDAKPGLTRAALDAAMTGHVLSSGELIGLYQRR